MTSHFGRVNCSIRTWAEVKPYQPAGMWKALSHPASNTKNYKADTGRMVYRRSLYVYWKRTSPHPMMTLFDAPNRDQLRQALPHQHAFAIAWSAQRNTAGGDGAHVRRAPAQGTGHR